MAHQTEVLRDSLNRAEHRTAARAIMSELRRFSLLRSTILSIRHQRGRLIDRWFGIDTSSMIGRPTVAPTRFADPVWYDATDYMLLRRYMKPLRVTADDVLFDIGCGMGRTLCMFAQRPIGKCIGIEIEPDLARRAEINAQRVRKRCAPIEIRVGDAAHADYSTGTIFWMNDPFGPQTIAAVLGQIEATLRSRPRPIQLVYVFPYHEHVIRSRPWLRCFHREKPLLFSTSQATYWTNQPA